MNFARDVVEAAPPGRRAMVALGRDGARREWTMGEVAARAARARRRARRARRRAAATWC